MIAVTNNNFAYYKNLKSKKLNKDNISFKGLTKNFSKQIYVDPLVLQANIGIVRKPIAGNIPREFINAISQNIPKKKAIEEIFQSFELASNELREAESLVLQTCEAKDSVQKIVEKFNEISPDGILDSMFPKEFTYGLDSLDKEVRDSYIDSASQQLEKSFKKLGIVPQKGKVQMKYLGCGAYGYAFNISFLDESGKKLFYDKTLKLYKKDVMDQNYYREMAQQQYDTHQNMDIEEELKAYSNILDSLEFDEDMKKAMIKIKRRSIEEIKKLTLDELYENFTKQDKIKMQVHGVIPEANRALFIKKQTPDMIHSNFVVPHFFDFKNRIALFDTANEELPIITKEIDVDDFDLIASDIDFNENNTVCERVIDYGGMVPASCAQDLSEQNIDIAFEFFNSAFDSI